MNARRVAYEVVRRTFEEGAYADRAFPSVARRLDARDRRQAMRLAFGAVQRVRTVDHAMETLAGRSPGKLQPQLRSALRVSGYEVLFSDGVPARAAVARASSSPARWPASARAASRMRCSGA